MNYSGEIWAINIFLFFICSSKLVMNINVPYMVVHYEIYVQSVYENQVVVRMSIINVFNVHVTCKVEV